MASKPLYVSTQSDTLHAYQGTNMNSSSFFRHCRMYTAVAVTLALAACASLPAPTAQMAVSRAAVATAFADGAGEYAPLELKSAQDKMEHAERAMAREDYGVARTLAEEAQLDAQLAEKKTEAAKAQKAAAATQEGNRVLREELERKNK